MRSRYSAFVLDVRVYLMATWHPNHRPAHIDAPEPGLRWLGLQVVSARQWCDERGEDRGEVTFVARSKVAGRAHRLVERSGFVREAGLWLYTCPVGDADQAPGSRS